MIQSALLSRQNSSNISIARVQVSEKTDLSTAAITSSCHRMMLMSQRSILGANGRPHVINRACSEFLKLYYIQFLHNVTVMVNFMCQFGRAMGDPDMCLNIILGVSVKELSDEISI